MYGGNRTWGTDSIGATAPAPVWYLAEGSTGGGFETWVLVQNPGADVTVDLTFMTSSGTPGRPPGRDHPGRLPHTFKLNDYVTDYNVSTMVTATGGKVICERAMYGAAAPGPPTPSATPGGRFIRGREGRRALG